MIDPVTARYAEALFNLAKERGALDGVASDVRQLGDALARPEFGSFFFDERVSIETRRAKLEALLARMHALTRNFVNLLFDKRREAVLRDLGPAFHRRLLVERGAAEGTVESARPLASPELTRLEQSMGRRIGKSLRLENRVVPELLGGVRVIVESRMIDASLRGRLEGLRKRMVEAPLPTLQEA
jgi:F-type H+-transporting ATPase subunit delta